MVRIIRIATLMNAQEFYDLAVDGIDYSGCQDDEPSDDGDVRIEVPLPVVVVTPIIIGKVISKERYDKTHSKGPT